MEENTHNRVISYTNFETLVALEAKIEQKLTTLKNQRKQGSQQHQQQSGNQSGGQQSNNNNQSGSQNNTNRRSRKKKPVWMTKKPAEADINKVKVVDGKEYWWCPNHKAFTRHKPSECQGRNVNLEPFFIHQIMSENSEDPTVRRQIKDESPPLAIFWDLERMPLPQGRDESEIVVADLKGVLASYGRFGLFNLYHGTSQNDNLRFPDCQLRFINCPRKDLIREMITCDSMEFAFGHPDAAATLVFVTDDPDLTYLMSKFKKRSQWRTVVVSREAIPFDCNVKIRWNDDETEAVQENKGTHSVADTKQDDDGKNDEDGFEEPAEFQPAIRVVTPTKGEQQTGAKKDIPKLFQRRQSQDSVDSSNSERRKRINWEPPPNPASSRKAAAVHQVLLLGEDTEQEGRCKRRRR